MFGHGVTDWLEAGLYLPLQTIPGRGPAHLDRLKLRAPFVEPNAANRGFFYGIDSKFSFDNHR